MNASPAPADHVLGAQPHGDGTTFRVWAPAARQVRVELTGGAGARRHSATLAREPDGYFSGVVAGAGPGTLYRYRLDDADALPDPCSRYQPEGPHGPSMVTDPHTYRWHDAGWQGITLAGQVIYELHVGTFTTEGTLDAASRELPELKALGVTKLDFTERETHAPVYRLHRDLLALRRNDPVIAAQRREAIDGAVLGDEAFVLRWFDAASGDRLLLVNLGRERRVSPVPEPLLAPPRGHAWRRVWSSDDPAYDGPGITEPQVADGWRLPGESAIFLRAVARTDITETPQDAA